MLGDACECFQQPAGRGFEPRPALRNNTRCSGECNTYIVALFFLPAQPKPRSLAAVIGQSILLPSQPRMVQPHTCQAPPATHRTARRRPWHTATCPEPAARAAMNPAAGPAAGGIYLNQSRPRLGKAILEARRRLPGHQHRAHHQHPRRPAHTPVRAQKRHPLLRQKQQPGCPRSSGSGRALSQITRMRRQIRNRPPQVLQVGDEQFGVASRPPAHRQFARPPAHRPGQVMLDVGGPTARHRTRPTPHQILLVQAPPHRLNASLHTLRVP